MHVLKGQRKLVGHAKGVWERGPGSGWHRVGPGESLVSFTQKPISEYGEGEG